MTVLWGKKTDGLSLLDARHYFPSSSVTFLFRHVLWPVNSLFYIYFRSGDSLAENLPKLWITSLSVAPYQKTPCLDLQQTAFSCFLLEHCNALFLEPIFRYGACTAPKYCFEMDVTSRWSSHGRLILHQQATLSAVEYACFSRLLSNSRPCCSTLCYA